MNISLEEIASEIHDNALVKGFWNDKDGEDRVNQILAKMMLIDSEVSEMMEAYRKEKGGEEILKEAADILVRLLDLLRAMEDYGIVEGDFTEVFLAKVDFNQSRPPKHGNLM